MGTRCAPAKLRPLSTEAQEMARQNIQTITRFLSHHRLSDDWYDVVVFRYLLTVQNWMERPGLHRRKRQRRIQTVSLDAPVPDTDGVTIGDTITADNLCYVPYQG